MNIDLYSFIARGLMMEASLEQTERLTRRAMSDLFSETAARLPLAEIDEEKVAAARKMAPLYVSIAAFENSVRAFVVKRLLEGIGADWWDKISEKIRTRAETRRDEESKIRWHTPRGDAPINYTEFGDLASIISQHWTLFEDYVQSQDWARHIFSTLERSRNVIMHSGELGMQDIERIGTVMRDWIRQIGA
jgi:hypothetical protein